jgi:hypothetical protein
MTPPDLAQVLHSFERHLHLPDAGIIHLVLGAAIANRLPGDPVWLQVAGPPSSGKTETLESLIDIPWIRPASTFSEAGLINGTRGTTRPGLLFELPERAVIEVKDFTTILSESATTRNRTFAILREVFDGRVTRDLGTGHFEWEGTVGLIAAVTEYIYECDLGALGERFCYYRLPPSTPEDDEIACWVAAENADKLDQIRAGWRATVAAFVDSLDVPDALPALAEADQHRLNVLATTGARYRSSVRRDGYTREIDMVPSAERPMRLLSQLAKLRAGLEVIGTPEGEIWRLLPQVAQGGIHPDRRRVLDVLVNAADVDLSTAAVTGRARLSPTPAYRHLQDLHALEVVEKTGDAPDRWRLSDWLRDRWWAVDGTCA